MTVAVCRGDRSGPFMWREGKGRERERERERERVRERERENIKHRNARTKHGIASPFPIFCFPTNSSPQSKYRFGTKHSKMKDHG